jgi:hypothetical protein
MTDKTTGSIVPGDRVILRSNGEEYTVDQVRDDGHRTRSDCDKNSDVRRIEIGNRDQCWARTGGAGRTGIAPWQPFPLPSARAQ